MGPNFPSGNWEVLDTAVTLGRGHVEILKFVLGNHNEQGRPSSIQVGGAFRFKGDPLFNLEYRAELFDGYLMSLIGQNTFFEGDKDIVLTTHGLTSGSLTSPEVQGQLQLGVPGIRLPFRPSCQPHTIDMAYFCFYSKFPNQEFGT